MSGRGVLMGWVALLAVGVAASPASAAADRPAPLAGAAARNPIAVTQTSPLQQQELTPLTPLRFTARRPKRGVRVIRVNDNARYQRILGVGAAMTDSAAWLLWDELPQATRAQEFTSLFGSDGIHLSFLRVPMGASDFSATGVPYTYDDMPAGESDPTLANFSIGHDEAYILPALLLARSLNPEIYLEAMPWSPPAWMKTNDALSNPDHQGTLLGTVLPSLAQYFVDFLQQYAAAGVFVNAIAPANEPSHPTDYPGLEMDQTQEVSFVESYLRPALSAAGLDPSVFGWDLSWGPLGPSSPLVQATHTELTGLAWHCYFGSPDDMVRVHTANPDAEQIVDECSTRSAYSLLSTSEVMIASFRHDANAYAAWNLALDPAGGPVQAPNAGCVSCTGIVTVDEATGLLTPTIDYYELGQVSKFVSPGAVRIASPHFVKYALSPGRQAITGPGLDDVAFLDPGGAKVLVVYNTGGRPIPFALRWRGRYASYTMPGGATTTFVWH